MATIDVKDAAGNPVAIEKPLVPGRAAAVNSRPIALSTEDKAALDAVSASLVAIGLSTDGIEALLSAATPAGANLIGRAVVDASAATGGITSTSRILSAAASTNGTSAKASAGRLYAIQGYNASSFVRYLKLYNKASAPTVGTDTPIKTLALPPGVGFAFDWPVGYYFGTGIAYGLTTGAADNDTGALAAADVVGLNLDYA
ncbi:hypothetical protein [Tardiphaga sp.]|jgi:hypothetical protein|uniref:hypothetical protein n=1 Tax=Tardiphaga sp. TaxID=1926292 RepID=UPI0037DA5796